jgi:hypothetical protein
METIVDEVAKFITTHGCWIIGFLATMLIISICCIKFRRNEVRPCTAYC